MRNDAINMEVNEGLLAFGAEEEGAVGGVVHEEVFGEDGRAGGVAEEVEVFLEVGVGVGVVGADAVAGEVAPVPRYFVDFREKLSSDPNIRWTDRVYPDGMWEPNLYQFYRRVLPKLSLASPTPFQMEGVYRQDETTAHKAVREALVNCIVHASTRLYEGPVIERYPDRLYFSNPGTMFVSVEDFFEGGHSICRNSALHKMFEMIGGGERAGSGAIPSRKAGPITSGQRLKSRNTSVRMMTGWS